MRPLRDGLEDADELLVVHEVEVVGHPDALGAHVLHHRGVHVDHAGDLVGQLGNADVPRKKIII